MSTEFPGVVGRVSAPYKIWKQDPAEMGSEQEKPAKVVERA